MRDEAAGVAPREQAEPEGDGQVEHEEDREPRAGGRRLRTGSHVRARRGRGSGGASRASAGEAHAPGMGLSLLNVSTTIFHWSPTFLKIVTYLPTSWIGFPLGPVMPIW